MPLLQKKNSLNNENLTSSRPFTKRPATLDREQLETLFGYGIILFTAIGVLASVTYMTVQQLRK